MTEETTLRPAERQREMGAKDAPSNEFQAVQTQAQTLKGVACPKCGTINDEEARYCASCGELLRKGSCPNCGSELDADADFCEFCHHYVRPDICSFCGAHFHETDPYCPECGSPRGGIVCPTCHTLNDFAFCKQCGQPLTEEARQTVEQLRMTPEFQELTHLAREYNELQMQLPYSSDSDMLNDERSLQLRERVLRLLAEDAGIAEPDIPQTRKPRVKKELLDAQKKKTLDLLSALLDKMALPAAPSPAKVRNYAMAQKPVGVRLAWKCNYKNALHSSPCGCAKPQLGGKWVVLGHSSNQEIKDDK